MKVGIIATDLDGTFLRDDHQFDRGRFQAQLDQMNHQGQHFVVASGNQLQHCIDVLDGITGELTYVAENGGLVIDSNGQPLSESLIDLDLLQELLTFVATTPALSGAQISVSGKRGAYIRPVDDSAVMRYFLSNLQIVSDLSAIDDHVYKATFSWPDADASADWHAAAINQQFAGRLRATVSGGNGLDVIPPHVNKAAGLAYLQTHWQVPASLTAAFGDNGNDLEMLREADYSYAMQNAIAPVKEVARFQTKLDNNHDGVLATIDQLI
ncbi:HAD family hydrolase [Lactiplantibacillus garii]|uniref:HAD family hydrolase n=1 Tax=Lactiplantibacillus garii TaxID=2306423 RepID=A0A3R8J8V5_9LACO|nr:Cof-type HAD-IIB family hydrolase [Lactiplantibacillus garii]RRK10982.1 HAD family hydrolase [Lactiplantibacillus garii]